MSAGGARLPAEGQLGRTAGPAGTFLAAWPGPLLNFRSEGNCLCMVPGRHLVQSEDS
jgi:hypothetical protein